MTQSLRRVAVVLFVLFAALFVNLNYLQVIRASELANHDRNSRGLIREYQRQRGAMLVPLGAERLELARSVETEGRLRFLRTYPRGPAYAHVTGYYSYIYGRAQLEQTFNPFLAGNASTNLARNLGQLLSGEERRGDDVILTLRPDVQDAAIAALGERRGAVVALEPATGAVLALVSSPTYDPNLLTVHDRTQLIAYWEATEVDPAKPRLNRVTRERYPPGSTFKVVTAAAALGAGLVTPGTEFDDAQVFDVPQTTADIRNFGGGLCNGGRPLTLRRAMAVSCNTTFAQLGVQVGSAALIEQAQRFGFNVDWRTHLPLVPSELPAELDVPATAQSAIGQRDVRATPLQMAVAAAAIGNNGQLMTPRLVQRVEDFAGRLVREFPPEPLRLPAAPTGQAVSPATAAALRDLMVAVVAEGSGQRAAIPGIQVAGKTGTAQVGEGRPPTVWFIGFAPAEQPRVAVAVVLEEGGQAGDEATGGRIAAPIAQAVMQAALAAPPT